MKTGMWLHAWDLEGWDPAAFVEHLRGAGIEAVHLAMAYHASRQLLPAHRRRRVQAIDTSAIYLPIGDEARRALRLADWDPPVAAAESALVEPFLAACRRADLPVRAWIVLCHQDGIAAESEASRLCVTNVYGDRYGYALCPSQPAVRDWCAALCATVATHTRVDAIDVEAAAFLGVDHQAAHDKRGLPLPAPINWLLSICLCSACRATLDPACAEQIAVRARTAVDAWLRDWPASETALAGRPVADVLEEWLGSALLRPLLALRDASQRALLALIRASTADTRLLVRVASSPWFTGAKTTLPLDTVASHADGAVLSWLGGSLDAMRADLAALPPRAARPLPLHGGFTLHAPDCRTPADVRARMDLLRAADLESAIAYAYGLASRAHLDWLRDATFLEPRRTM